MSAPFPRQLATDRRLIVSLSFRPAGQEYLVSQGNTELLRHDDALPRRRLQQGHDEDRIGFERRGREGRLRPARRELPFAPLAAGMLIFDLEQVEPAQVRQCFNVSERIPCQV